MSRGLSALQADILRYVLSNTQHIEENGSDNYRWEVAYWGIHWRPFGDGHPNASERASMSRALRRLDARGLVQRRNSHSGDRHQERQDRERPAVTRTICVKLTEEGRSVAERLTKETTEAVNRLEAA